MLKQVIKYTNFAEEEKTLEAYFHLGKPDIARIAADPAFLQEMEEAARKDDRKVMLAKIEYLVRLSYGIRSEDGEHFVKTPEIQDRFIQSAAYEEFLTQILTTQDAFTKFIKGVLPAKAMKELQDMIDKGQAPDPFAEPTEVHRSAAAQSEQKVVHLEGAGIVPTTVSVDKDGRPAWERENRQPTRKELMEMPREQMLKAFQQHPSLLAEKIRETE